MNLAIKGFAVGSPAGTAANAEIIIIRAIPRM
jgi:hypothetical protein